MLNKAMDTKIPGQTSLKLSDQVSTNSRRISLCVSMFQQSAALYKFGYILCSCYLITNAFQLVHQDIKLRLCQQVILTINCFKCRKGGLVQPWVPIYLKWVFTQCSTWWILTQFWVCGNPYFSQFCFPPTSVTSHVKLLPLWPCLRFLSCLAGN